MLFSHFEFSVYHNKWWFKFYSLIAMSGKQHPIPIECTCWWNSCWMRATDGQLDSSVSENEFAKVHLHLNFGFEIRVATFRIRIGYECESVMQLPICCTFESVQCVIQIQENKISYKITETRECLKFLYWIYDKFSLKSNLNLAFWNAKYA